MVDIFLLIQSFVDLLLDWFQKEYLIVFATGSDLGDYLWDLTLFMRVDFVQTLVSTPSYIASEAIYSSK